MCPGCRWRRCTSHCCSGIRGDRLSIADHDDRENKDDADRDGHGQGEGPGSGEHQHRDDLFARVSRGRDVVRCEDRQARGHAQALGVLLRGCQGAPRRPAEPASTARPLCVRGVDAPRANQRSLTRVTEVKGVGSAHSKPSIAGCNPSAGRDFVPVGAVLIRRWVHDQLDQRLVEWIERQQQVDHAPRQAPSPLRMPATTTRGDAPIATMAIASRTRRDSRSSAWAEARVVRRTKSCS